MFCRVPDDWHDMPWVLGKLLHGKNPKSKIMTEWDISCRPILSSTICNGQWPQERLFNTGRGWTDDNRCQLCYEAVGSLDHRTKCKKTTPTNGWPTRPESTNKFWNQLTTSAKHILKTRGLAVVRARVRATKEEEIVWKKRVGADVPESSLTWYIDGSLIDGPYMTLGRTGVGFAAIDQGGILRAYGYGLPPDWILTTPSAEAWALGIVLTSTCERHSVITDCLGNVTAVVNGVQEATASNKLQARIWGPIFAALDNQFGTGWIQWMPAHTTKKMVGVALKSSGDPISHNDHRANNLVDELAKYAARLRRAPEYVRAIFESAEAAIEYAAALIGVTGKAATTFQCTIEREDGTSEIVTKRDLVPLAVVARKPAKAKAKAEATRRREAAATAKLLQQTTALQAVDDTAATHRKAVATDKYRRTMLGRALGTTVPSSANTNPLRTCRRCHHVAEDILFRFCTICGLALDNGTSLPANDNSHPDPEPVTCTPPHETHSPPSAPSPNHSYAQLRTHTAHTTASKHITSTMTASAAVAIIVGCPTDEPTPAHSHPRSRRRTTDESQEVEPSRIRTAEARSNASNHGDCTQSTWNPTRVEDKSALFGHAMRAVHADVCDKRDDDDSYEDWHSACSNHSDDANHSDDDEPAQASTHAAKTFSFNSPSVMEELAAEAEAAATAACQSLEEQLRSEREHANEEAQSSDDDEPSHSGHQCAQVEEGDDGTTGLPFRQVAHPELASMGLEVTAQQINSTKQNKRRALEAKHNRGTTGEYPKLPSTAKPDSSQYNGGPRRIVNAVREWWDAKRGCDRPCPSEPATVTASTNDPPAGADELHEQAAETCPSGVDAAPSSTPKQSRTRNLANEQWQNTKRAMARAEKRAERGEAASSSTDARGSDVPKRFRITSKMTSEQTVQLRYKE